MLALADETWLTLGLAVLAQVGSMWSMWLRSRGQRKDSDDALLALGRAAARQSDEVDALDTLKRRAMAATERVGAKESLGRTMEVVLSESAKIQVRKLRGY